MAQRARRMRGRTRGPQRIRLQVQVSSLFLRMWAAELKNNTVMLETEGIVKVKGSFLES